MLRRLLLLCLLLFAVPALATTTYHAPVEDVSTETSYQTGDCAGGANAGAACTANNQCDSNVCVGEEYSGMVWDESRQLFYSVSDEGHLQAFTPAGAAIPDSRVDWTGTPDWEAITINPDADLLYILDETAERIHSLDLVLWYADGNWSPALLLLQGFTNTWSTLGLPNVGGLGPESLTFIPLDSTICDPSDDCIEGGAFVIGDQVLDSSDTTVLLLDTDGSTFTTVTRPSEGGVSAVGDSTLLTADVCTTNWTNNSVNGTEYNATTNTFYFQGANGSGTHDGICVTNLPTCAGGTNIGLTCFADSHCPSSTCTAAAKVAEYDMGGDIGAAKEGIAVCDSCGYLYQWIDASTISRLKRWDDAYEITRYVDDTGGSDSGNCALSASPCATIEYCSNQMNPGDTCTVADGQYAGATIDNDCSAGNPCTIKSTNVSGAVTTSSVSGCYSGLSYAFCLHGAKNVVMDGFRMGTTLTGTRGCMAGNGVDDLTIQNTTCNHTATGGTRYTIRNSPSGLVFQDNTVEMISSQRCGSTGGYCGCNPEVDCIGNPDIGECSFGSYSLDFDNINGATIQDNVIGFNNELFSLDNSSDITVRRNRFGFYTEHGLQVGDVNNLLIENNIWAYEDTSGDCASYTLNGAQSSFRGVDIYCGEDITIRNNSFMGHDYLIRNTVTLYGSSVTCPDAGLPVCESSGTYGTNPGKCFVNDLIMTNNIMYDTFGASSGQFNQLTGGSRNTATGTFKIDANIYHDGPGYSLPGNSGRLWECDTDLDNCGPAPFGCGAGQTFQAGQFSSDYKTGSGCWTNNTTGGANEILSTYNATTPPTFTNYASADYTPLNSSSTQVNSGITGQHPGNSNQYCASEDFNENPRNDGQCDIGAFEFQGGVPEPQPGGYSGALVDGSGVFVNGSAFGASEGTLQICTGSTESLMGTCETQTVVTWSSNQIAFTAVAGTTFVAPVTGYLFVTDTTAQTNDNGMAVFWLEGGFPNADGIANADGVIIH